MFRAPVFWGVMLFFTGGYAVSVFTLCMLQFRSSLASRKKASTQHLPRVLQRRILTDYLEVYG